MQAHFVDLLLYYMRTVVGYIVQVTISGVEVVSAIAHFEVSALSFPP